MAPMKILAIDPAIRSTGFAIVEGDHREHRCLEFGVISIPSRQAQSAALAAVRTGLANLIAKWEPDEVAVILADLEDTQVTQLLDSMRDDMRVKDVKPYVEAYARVKAAKAN